MPSTRHRDRPVAIRLTSEEHAMLHALAEQEGLTASDVVRQFIRRAYRKAFGDKPPRGRTKR